MSTERERSTPSNGDFTITLLVFSWSLLPVGFMVMLWVFGRYEAQHLPLAAISLALLSFAFWTGVTQRRNALREGRVQLTMAVFALAWSLLVLVWGLELTAWWHAVYAAVIGCVPVMYVSLDNLSSCTPAGWMVPWSPSTLVPMAALSGWTVQSARWRNGDMAWRLDEHDLPVTLFGTVIDGRPWLAVEAMHVAEGAQTDLRSYLDWPSVAAFSVAVDEEA